MTALNKNDVNGTPLPMPWAHYNSYSKQLLQEVELRSLEEERKKTSQSKDQDPLSVPEPHTATVTVSLCCHCMSAVGHTCHTQSLTH